MNKSVLFYKKNKNKKKNKKMTVHIFHFPQCKHSCKLGRNQYSNTFLQAHTNAGSFDVESVVLR